MQTPTKTSASKTMASPQCRLLPDAVLVSGAEYGQQLTRAGLVTRKITLRATRDQASVQYRTTKQAPAEKNIAFNTIQECVAEESRLEAILDSNFLPQHSRNQLLSPRAIFVSPLFRVRSKRITREEFVTFKMADPLGGVALGYRGPELRQSDGLVFMALLNLARDVKVGATVSFSPQELCSVVFGRYDGPSRKSLKEHIIRLQSALLIFKEFSVQMCQRFNYPSSGNWSVSLDADLVRLFSGVPFVWLQLEHRLGLPEGLATWLYAFIESQTRLIPTKVDSLRELCGSDANTKSFTGSLRDALVWLTNRNVIDAGWSIKEGSLRWMKHKSETVRLA